VTRFIRLACFSAVAAFFGTSSALADPVARWGFGTEETSRLTEHGGVHRDLPGPRPPEFPDFDPNNLAVKFDGAGSHFSFADPGDNSPFDFTNGDAITLEGWVNVADLKKGENAYIIGKGRTGDAGFAKDNQNWALRLREGDGQARPSFLFATPHPKGAQAAKDAQWHRWTTISGFTPGSGWHHVAVAYRFGDPESVKGWVDGKPVKGTWDMGGASKDAPVVDNDSIWIGSSQAGAASNSFRGMLDEVLIHRDLLTDEVMKARYRREGPETVVQQPPASEKAPSVDQIPAGKVLFTFYEGLAVHDKWPKESDPQLVEVEQWASDVLILPRLPTRFDEWGIRQGWKAPVLVRMAADLKLPPGKQTFLLRSRGLSRMWVNGQVVLRGKVHGTSSDGHEPVQPVPTPPLPGMRPVGFGDNEESADVTIGADGQCRLILESIVGGKKFRPEPGEMCVAILATDGKAYNIVQATRDANPAQFPLTDAGWERASAAAETSLAAFDDATRSKLAATEHQFWEKRHTTAKKWLADHPGPAAPQAAGSLAAGGNPIDAFLAKKVSDAIAASANAGSDESKHFYGKVLPVLQENCFRCHGEKEKGDLRLNTRVAAVKAGSSGKPAVVPGDVAKSELIRRIKSDDADERMPPKGDGLNKEQIAAIEAWVKSGAAWPAAPVSKEEVTAPPSLDDAAFLRRVTLDTIGVPASEEQARAFLQDPSPDKRARLVDQLLADPRYADHWMSYWQDVLAENPNMLKPSLNNSGPFRWFLYDALRDNKPMDRLVTELLLLRGGKYEGGSAGFGMAADNDAPLAAKGQILAGAFLGVELQCARCHDSPFHSTKQKDLYSLAAMLERKEVTVPKSSTVPPGFFEKKARESLIKVTLKPGEKIQPVWPFEKVCGVKDDASLDTLLHDPKDTRERLAALVTSPANNRFAQVLVNRVWKRLIGAGIVEPAHDWEGHAASHPEMLEWLARDLAENGYDLKHTIRLILTSQIYQREATGANQIAGSDRRFFVAPDRRRLTGEQVVDSLFAAAGKKMRTEELSFDPDGRRPGDTMISLGRPSRAWMLASLSNERDRPSLALPRAQVIADVLEAFGWSGSRQNPRTDRETDPNVLQPGVLANSILSTWITRASNGSGLADLAAEAPTPEALVDSVFIRFLNRPASAAERAQFSRALSDGFANRLVSPGAIETPAAPQRLPRISWSNHLAAEATTVKLEMETRARAGDPADPRLTPSWRETYEDFVWAVINSPEFVWIP
jgi:mono/diheme cytochrome c family protein